MKRVNVLVDFGKAFVDPDGNFYCGTTKKQKENAVAINKDADLTIYFADVHTRDSSEFLVNGGLYPTHNLLLKDQYDLQAIGVGENKTVSPQLTEPLQNIVKDRKSGLLVPRHVYFQDYNGEDDPKPQFTPEDVASTFDLPIIGPQMLVAQGIEYVVNAKHMLNGAGLQATEQFGKFGGIPDQEYNALTLLKQEFGQGEELTFDITGVVMGICIYQTASNVRQIFPKAELNIISDGCTHLLIPQLGLADEDTANLVAKKMCQQIGINYITTLEYLGKIKS